MRKLVVALLVLASCGRREVARRETPPPPPQPVAKTATSPVVVPKPRGVSTPTKCAGDGSYDEAVECFRMSSGFRFRVTSPALSGRGTMQRPRIGMERVTIGEWSAETKPGGIVWLRGGKPATPPPDLERLYQRLTLYLDPQKKEESPQLVDEKGKTKHYHFTDANSGEPYDVFVAKDDGRIVELRAGKTDITIQ